MKTTTPAAVLFAFVLVASMAVGQTPTVGTTLLSPSAFDGYTLLMPDGMRQTYLIDNCGRVVRTWTSPYPPAQVARLLPGGRLLRAARVPNAFNAGGSGGRIEIYDWNGALVWGYNYAGADFCQHHDICPLPNGNILVLAWERHTAAEAAQAGRDTVVFGAHDLWAERVVELAPVGADSAQVVWEWRVWDHLVQDRDPALPNFGIVADHPELLNINVLYGQGTELLHFNSVDFNPATDQVLLSSPLMSEIYIVDHTTSTADAAGHTGGLYHAGGDLLFRWGNPQVYGHGSATDQQFFGQHDAQWIDDGLVDAGKIMVFNNGMNRPQGSYSSVDIIEPYMNESGHYSRSPGGTYEPYAPSWSFTGTGRQEFFSANSSGAQRLPNGATLICEATKARILEIDPSGATAWEYISPVSQNGPLAQGTPAHGNPLFRAYKYAADGPELIGFALTPGDHIELNPILSACDSVAAAVAEVPTRAALAVFGNPFHEALTIASGTGDIAHAVVSDVTGRVVAACDIRGSVKLETSLWASGSYLVHLSGKGVVPGTVRLVVKE